MKRTDYELKNSHIKSNLLVSWKLPYQVLDCSIPTYQLPSKKLVSVTNDCPTEQITNVWSFMIMSWAIRVHIKWQKNKAKVFIFAFIDIIWDSPEFKGSDKNWDKSDRYFPVQLPSACRW